MTPDAIVRRWMPALLIATVAFILGSATAIGAMTAFSASASRDSPVGSEALKDDVRFVVLVGNSSVGGLLLHDLHEHRSVDTVAVWGDDIRSFALEPKASLVLVDGYWLEALSDDERARVLTSVAREWKSHPATFLAILGPDCREIAAGVREASGTQPARGDEITTGSYVFSGIRQDKAFFETNVAGDSSDPTDVRSGLHEVLRWVVMSMAV